MLPMLDWTQPFHYATTTLDVLALWQLATSGYGNYHTLQGAYSIVKERFNP